MEFVRDPEPLATARRRVFLHIDPGFGQGGVELGFVLEQERVARVYAVERSSLDEVALGSAPLAEVETLEA